MSLERVDTETVNKLAAVIEAFEYLPPDPDVIHDASREIMRKCVLDLRDARAELDMLRRELGELRGGAALLLALERGIKEAK
ncbi:MAG TPA: hypothetical protein VM238_18290 [Phycisphaerae bacterium]|nr:hypothetical protein [Phycisphaerae bacterium]